MLFIIGQLPFVLNAASESSCLLAAAIVNNLSFVELRRCIWALSKGRFITRLVLCRLIRLGLIHLFGVIMFYQ